MGRGPGIRRRPPLLALASPIAALSAISAVGTLLTPALAPHHSLLLVALSPRSLNLVVAASSAPLVTFLLVGVLRLVAADPWHFLLGRHGGDELTAWAGRRSLRAGRAMVRAQRMVSRVGVTVVAVRPCGPVLVAAGACRLSPTRVAVANVTGTAAYVLATYLLGRTVADPLDRAFALLSPEVLAAAVVAVGIVIAARWCRGRWLGDPGRHRIRAAIARFRRVRREVACSLSPWSDKVD